jgi:protein ImuB
MRLSAAFALLPRLKALERSAVREHRAITAVAAWLQQFSPLVSLEAADVLVVEIRGSLRLFGDHEALRKRVITGLEALGYTVHTGLAPTVLAATWLARARCAAPVLELAALPGRLSALPLACLDWPQAVQERLAGIGAHTLGDCLRLPRDGLARRLGSSYVDLLDRALGRQADPRQSLALPETFRSTLELAWEVEEVRDLGPWVERLLREMQAFLRARQAGVEQLELLLIHPDRPPTRMRLGLARLARDAARPGALLQEKLDRLELPAPVIAMTLRASSLQPLGERDADLFPGPAGGDAGSEELSGLLERLRARLGEEAVHGVGLVREHRPEAAWRRNEPGQASAAHPPRLRPMWLLAAPYALEISAGYPCWEGRLRLESGPERIETGWWDGRPVARDYFVAANPAGIRLWIYRERGTRRAWFLHGIFG